jgi:sugar-specific transcriptional regulator TrmB
MTELFDFEEIGLEKRDKKVYEALVAHPGSSLRSIAADTGINRGSVYESVKQLADRGLVGSIEVGKQRRYTANDARTILELLRERQAQAQLAERSAYAYIDALPRPSADTHNVPFATYYEDIEGIAGILRDVLSTCQEQAIESYRVITTKRVREHIYENFRNFTQRRIATGVSVRALAVGSGGSNDYLSERRWLESTRGNAPNCYTIIYGDKTAFITIDDANVLSGIVIDNPGVAQLQKELFDRLWQTS